MRITIQEKHIGLQFERAQVADLQDLPMQMNEQIGIKPSSIKKRMRYQAVRRNHAITIEFSNEPKKETSQFDFLEKTGSSMTTAPGRMIAGLCVKSRKKTIHVRSRYHHIKITYIIEKAMPTLLAITPTKEWYSNFKDVQIHAKRI